MEAEIAQDYAEDVAKEMEAIKKIMKESREMERNIMRQKQESKKILAKIREMNARIDELFLREYERAREAESDDEFVIG